MDAKATILKNLRNQLRVKHTLSERQKNATERVEEKPRGVLPKFAKSKTALAKRFIKHAEGADAKVVRVTSKTIADKVSEFLRQHNLPMRIRCGSDEQLENVISKSKKLIEFSFGPSDGGDLVGLSVAECGVCETGTLAMLSGDANPTTINFLPENHIVIVKESDLVMHYEDIWDRVRTNQNGEAMPRTINLITGPSRSGDIEQKLILGAHGPTRLHILLLNE